MTYDERDIWRKVTDDGGRRGRGGPRGRGGHGHGAGRGGHGGPFAPGGPGGPGAPPPWLQDLVRNFGGPEFARGFGGPGRGRGPKARRGDVRGAILDVLADEPLNGYQLIQAISERTDGVWKPSPGSVYPTVQQLEDEGLIEGVEVDGRRLLRLTDEGRSWREEHPDEIARTWSSFEETSTPPAAAGGADLMPEVGQVMSAVWQIAWSGTQQQRAEAAEVLGETRRRLYGLLADGER